MVVFNVGAFPDPATGEAATGSPWPSAPETSLSTVRVDGADSVYGTDRVEVMAPTDSDAATKQFSLGYNDVLVTQTLQLVESAPWRGRRGGH